MKNFKKRQLLNSMMRSKVTILLCILLLGYFQIGKSAVCAPAIENAVDCGTISGTQIVTKCIDQYDGIIYYPYDSSSSTTIKPTLCDVCVKETMALTDFNSAKGFPE